MHCRLCKRTIFDLIIRTSHQDEEGYLVGTTEYVCHYCRHREYKSWKSLFPLKIKKSFSKNYEDSFFI